jgi:L-lactate dehydrogenase complex protein LldE
MKGGRVEAMTTEDGRQAGLSQRGFVDRRLSAERAGGRQWVRMHPASGTARWIVAYNGGVPDAQLFVTCILDSLFPQAGEAVAALLEALGVRVSFPLDQTCCGQPAYNGGFRAEARRMAQHVIAVFERSPAPLVTPSGSCAAMIVHGYPDLLAGDPAWHARAQALAARTYELTQYLSGGLGVTPAQIAALHAQRPAAPRRVAYHASCHSLRGLGLAAAVPEAYLRALPGVEVVPLPGVEECCGFGGVFAIKHGEISSAMLDRKLAVIAASGAELVTGLDLSCLMHLQGALNRDGSPVRCQHIAELLVPE